MNLLSKLRNDTSGVAMIEFAVALPAFLAMAGGGLEYANLANTHLKVSQIAMTVADNAGRYDPSIDESDIDELEAATSSVGSGLDFLTNGRVVLSSLQHNGLSDDDEGQMINWQRCFGDLNIGSEYGEEDWGKTDDAMEYGMGPVGNTIEADEGTAVMFVEVTYNYQPFFPGFFDSREIRYESAFNVRTRNSFDITNAGNITVNDCTIT